MSVLPTRVVDRHIGTIFRKQEFLHELISTASTSDFFSRVSTLSLTELMAGVPQRVTSVYSTSSAASDDQPELPDPRVHRSNASSRLQISYV